MTSVALKNFPFSLLQDIIPHARKYDMKLFVLSRSRCSSWLYCSYSFSKSSFFGPEAKTRGGIIVVRAYIEYIYIYTRQNLDLAKVDRK